MNKNIKKISFLIAAILVSASLFTACGGGNNNAGENASSEGAAVEATTVEITAAEATTTEITTAEATTTTAPEKPDPIGKYTAVTDFQEYMNESMGEDAPFEITDPMPAEFDLELKADDTFVLGLNAEKFADTYIEWFKKNGVSIFEESFKAQGMTQEEIDSSLDVMGYDSLEAMVEEYSTMMGEEMKSSMGEMKIEGSYKIEGNNITFTPEEEGFEPKSTTFNDDGTITMNLDAEEMGEWELLFQK